MNYIKKPIILFFTYLAWASTIHAETNAITFGIVPQQSASRLASIWVPICKYLSKHTGVTINFKTAPNIPEFEKRLEKGEYDISYMNPYHYVYFHKHIGYQAFAKAKNRSINGIIVAHKDSKIKTLADLSGKEIAFPSPAAFAASILPRAELSQKNIIFTPKYVSSHDSVYKNVSKKFAIAGGGIKRTFNSFTKSERDNLVIIWKTKSYTPHALAHHPSMQLKIISKIQNAFEEFANSQNGRYLLKPLKIEGFEYASNKDWDDIRALNISLLEK